MKPSCDFWIYENILHNEQVDSARIMDRKLTDQSLFQSENSIFGLAQLSGLD